MQMNVQVLKQTVVTQTPCVPTPTVLMFVAVLKDMVETGETVQVKFIEVPLLHNSGRGLWLSSVANMERTNYNIVTIRSEYEYEN